MMWWIVGGGVLLYLLVRAYQDSGYEVDHEGGHTAFVTCGMLPASVMIVYSDRRRRWEPAAEFMQGWSRGDRKTVRRIVQEINDKRTCDPGE